MGYHRVFASILILFSRSENVFSQQIHHPDMGICQNRRTETMRCAMQESDCAPTHIDGQESVYGEKWLISANLKRMGLPGVEEICGCDENTLIGSCVRTDMNGKEFGHRCAHNRHACSEVNNEIFVSDSTLPDGTRCTCNHVVRTVNSQGKIDREMTTYGACVKFRTNRKQGWYCALQPSDCGDEQESSHRYMDAVAFKEFLGFDCTCDMVHTGGCRGASQPYCTVNEDSCGGGSRYSGIFYDPIEMKQKWNMNCRLCPPLPGTFEVKDEFDDSKAISREGKGPNYLVIGISIAGGVVGVGFLIGGVILYKRKRSKERNTVTKPDAKGAFN